MKTVSYIFSLSVVFLIASCNKKLDVQPQNDITLDQIKTSSDVLNVLAGGYAQLQNAAAFGEKFIDIPDLIANEDQVVFRGTFNTYKNIYQKQTTATNGVCADLWGNSYKIIAIANTVLDKLSIVDSSQRNATEAQAKFMRAITYFYLVNLFAKPYSDGGAATNLGVPITTAPVYTYDVEKAKLTRATVQQTYDQIISDLKDAFSKASYYPAEALLAKVYLVMGDYANAAANADDVITNGGYQLASSYDKEFNNAGPTFEDVFSISQTAQSNAGTTDDGIQTFYAPYSGLPSGYLGGRGDIFADSAYFTHFDSPDDFRQTYFTLGSSIAGVDGTYPNKWQKFYTEIPVIRLADMFLVRGEANLHNSAQVGLNTPDQDINIIRVRANADPLSGATQDDFVEERFREFGFEGDRFFTLKRLKMDVDGFDYDNKKLVLPLPQADVDANNKLIQNDGY
ncbi:MAG TPA: RagB/SusD family nutrient uptake outer membrane protein [Puia sp.]|nr:RagB/SusD family nutrient uptake outer membrane protein [Puia sp.]